jgi:Fe-S-cluster-containing dehydrogenase component/formate-dependent nitrite reductase membrane component NrfD
MATYGFAIDLRKCIGCHACTIACKAEHDIPIGVNRCWVKTVEKGVFPDTRRFFFPVLCNQCADAPCVRICPTNALFKRRDGIVDLHGESCIGCRACMEACPYDQLFIDPNTRTAEKCNFCANRVENRLLPACVSVCPTECRIFGDLDDPASEVSRIYQREAFMVRKPEKGTGPKVLYLGAEESVIRPEVSSRPLIYKEGQVHLRPLGAPVERDDAPGLPRVDYDVPHEKPWGFDMAVYLLTKGIAAGALFLSALLWWLGWRDSITNFVGPAIAVVFGVVTAAVLIADLERPERFYYILIRPNWRSWMVWGAYFLTAHGAIATFWLLAAWLGADAFLSWLVVPAIVASILATSYTGFLFAQGLARDLWQGPYAAVDLLAQAAAVGAATLIIAMRFVPGIDPAATVFLVRVLAVAVSAHLVFLAFEMLLAPSPSVHHELAVSTIRRGPYARLFWGLAVVGGGLLPLALLLASPSLAAATTVAAVLALAGGFAWEYIWVEAGQSVPLS